MSVETPETGQTDDLIFGVNGTRNATGTVLYRPDGSGYFKFSNWKSATSKLEDGTAAGGFGQIGPPDLELFQGSNFSQFDQESEPGLDRDPQSCYRQSTNGYQ